MIYALLAWLVALGCVGVVFTRVRRLAGLELPPTEALCERVLEETRGADAVDPAAARRVALDEMLLEVDRVTKRGAEWARALGRVSLATGTLLSLLVMIDLARSWSAVSAAFVAGVTGLLGTAMLGRLADQRARSVREHWSVVVRRARRRLDAQGS